MLMAKYREIPEFSGKEKEYFDALINYRDAVLGRMKQYQEDARDSANSDKRGVTTHMADVGSDNSRHEMDLQRLTEEGDVLELIEEAIQRLIDGEFGKCHDCGMDIPPARLAVRPYAIYCTKCKSIREQHNGHNPFVK